MDTVTAYRALRRGWHLLVIGALMAAAVGAFLSQRAPRIYEVAATYVISPAQTDAGGINDTVRTIEDARSRAVVGTYVEILASDSVAADAAAAIGMTTDLLEGYEISAVVLPEANIAELTVTGPDPILLADLVDSVGRVGGERFVGLYGIYATIPLDLPEVPTEPANPGLLQTAMLAAALGLLAGAAAALIVWGPRERRNREVMVRIDAYGDPGATVTPLPTRDRRATGTG